MVYDSDVCIQHTEWLSQYSTIWQKCLQALNLHTYDFRQRKQANASNILEYFIVKNWLLTNLSNELKKKSEERR